jgi:hypothetical protein
MYQFETTIVLTGGLTLNSKNLKPKQALKLEALQEHMGDEVYVQEQRRQLIMLILFTVAGATTLHGPKRVLATVSHVEEAVLILVLLVDRRHEGGCKRVLSHKHTGWKHGQLGNILEGIDYTSRWQGVIHKNEDGFLWAKLDPFPHHIDKMAYRQVSRYKVPA